MKPNTGQESPKTFRPGAKGLKRVLGELEADIMESVWSAEGPSPSLILLHSMITWAKGGTRNADPWFPPARE